MNAADQIARVNGVTITRGEAQSLALRLALRHGAREVSARLGHLAEYGGETVIGDDDARVVGAALQEWLEETNQAVLGVRLLELRDRLRTDPD